MKHPVMIAQKIQVLIVDDEPKSRNILQTMLTDYCTEIDIVGQANSVENAQYLIDLKNPDLVLLDIEMPFQNGFSLLEKVKNNRFEVVFVSAFDHYALESLKYHALDYLLKPIDLEELENVVKKVKAIKKGKLKSHSSGYNFINQFRNTALENKISIATQNGKKYISVSQIMYISADGPCSWIYMSNGDKFYTSKNLGQVEKNLKPYNCASFFRVHYAHLVNLLNVSSFYLNRNLLEFEDGSIIRVAQRRKKQLRRLLKDSCVSKSMEK